MTSRFVLLAAVLLIGSRSASGAPPSAGIRLVRCQLSHPVASARVPARCGTLEVL